MLVKNTILFYTQQSNEANKQKKNTKLYLNHPNGSYGLEHWIQHQPFRPFQNFAKPRILESNVDKDEEEMGEENDGKHEGRITNLTYEQ